MMLAAKEVQTWGICSPLGTNARCRFSVLYSQIARYKTCQFRGVKSVAINTRKHVLRRATSKLI